MHPARICYGFVAVGVTIGIAVITFPGLPKSTEVTIGIFHLLPGKYEIISDGRDHSDSSTAIYNSVVMSDSEPITSLAECKKKVHAEYLTPKQHEVWLKHGAKGCDYARCQFMNGTNRSYVPLVSFPGSGNTWARGLLEKATGICTGAVFFDDGLIKSGMVGEGVMDGTVVAIKMHSFSPLRMKNLKIEKSALLIVRNPFDTLVAEYTRQNSPGHTGIANKSLFGNDSKWASFVTANSAGWAHLTKIAITKSKLDNFELHIIRYEELKTDKVAAMEKVLQFLGFKYNKEDLAARLKDDYETFKRLHSKQHYEHFTAAQKTVVNQGISELMEFVKDEEFLGGLDFLSEYIQR